MSSAFDLVCQRLRELTGFDPGGNGSRTYRCPAHPDKKPSLSVTDAEDRVLITCQAGCKTDAVLAALNLDWPDLYDEPLNPSPPDKREIAAISRYVDENDVLQFEVVRFRPKDFRQRRPDGHGGYFWNVADTRRVLYRLPRVIDAIQQGRTVFVVEGEKDVEALERAGEIATCNPGGAGKWRPEYTDTLRGAGEVVIVADRDGPGYRHALQVYRALVPVVGHVVVVEARGNAKDAADHLAAGHTADDFGVITDDLAELAGLKTDDMHDPPAAGPDPVKVTGETPEPDGPSLFTIESVAEVARRVDGSPPVGWLAKPVWPADAYGVSAAEKKAGKTWLLLDLAVSVASGTPWLGVYECPTPGPVLLFLGEGGERKMLRRLRAIGRARGINVDQLPIRMSFRVPRLSNEAHLAIVAAELADHPAHLVGVDPLYLAAAGAKSSDLYAMGAVLQGVQLLCQQAGAALMVVTHWNKTGVGAGSGRMTGVGPAEWGRVLISVEVQHRHTETDRSTAVTLRIGFEGDEIPETELRLRRRVGAEDPDDLASPMHYRVETLDPEQAATAGTDGGLRPAARRILDVLRHDGGWLDLRQIGDLLAVDNTGMKPLKARTIQDGCKTLAAGGQIRTAQIDGTNALKWCHVTHEPPCATSERAQPDFRDDKNAL